MWSPRGQLKAKAVVTKRIKPLMCDGKAVHVVGIPHHFGFTGLTKPGWGPNSLTPVVGDANIETPEFKAWLVNIEKHHRAPTRPWHRRRGMTDYTSLDILQRSASTEQPPTIRSKTEVAKLIDVSKCIGCKACQSACEEWNDLRDDIGTNIGDYDQPARPLGDKSWTLMRFTEYENTGGELEWLIRKDGCMHCGDPGCLKACPSPGAIVQYANGIVDFVEENCIGCSYCVKGCPFNIPRISAEDRKAYKCTLCSDRVAVGQAPACAKACPTGAIMFGTKEAMIEQAERAHRRPQGAAASRMPGCTTRLGRWRHPCDVRAAPRRQAGHLRKPAEANPRISALVQFWKGGFKIFGLATLALATIGGFFHYVTAGPDEVPQAEEIEASAEAEQHKNDAPDANL